MMSIAKAALKQTNTPLAPPQIATANSLTRYSPVTKLRAIQFVLHGTQLHFESLLLFYLPVPVNHHVLRLHQVLGHVRRREDGRGGARRRLVPLIRQWFPVLVAFLHDEGGEVADTPLELAAPPAVVDAVRAFADHADDLAFFEGQFLLALALVVVEGATVRCRC